MFREFSEIIGKTPLVKIDYKYHNQEKSVYAKLEMFNWTGSIKDRVAYYMLKEALTSKALIKGMPIVEASSGNTGISLAALGAKLGFEVVIFMPDTASAERIKLMTSYGADVRLVSNLEGGFRECMKRALEYAFEYNGYFTNQFQNNANVAAHYETTGPEIYNSLKDKIGAFTSGVGSGGTLMGIGKYLKEQDEKIKIVALEPSSMPLLSGGYSFSPHQIEGIADEFIPPILDQNIIDEIILIEDQDALKMAQQLASLGLGVGISSGANMLASIIYGEKLSKSVVTVFADDNKKYLSTNLSQTSNEAKSIVLDIELLDFQII